MEVCDIVSFVVVGVFRCNILGLSVGVERVIRVIRFSVNVSMGEVVDRILGVVYGCVSLVDGIIVYISGGVGVVDVGINGGNSVVGYR